MGDVSRKEDHLADPEARDDGSVSCIGGVVVHMVRVVSVIFSWPGAEGREGAPGIVSEDSCGDDGGEVEAGAKTSAACGQATGVEAPGTENHQG